MNPWLASVGGTAAALRRLWPRTVVRACDQQRVAEAAGRSLPAETVLHHLRLFGLGGSAPMVLEQPGMERIATARAACAEGRVIVALRPSDAFCAGFTVAVLSPAAPPPAVLTAVEAGRAPWRRLRTLHPFLRFSGPNTTPLVTDEHGGAVWLWVPCGRSGVLLIGSALPEDLIRYRQGDPALAAAPDTRPVWGFDGERPMYLYDPQLAGEAPGERHADWWTMALVRALADHAGTRFATVLPGGAPGAVVITGDDDQAYLGKYEEQLQEIGDLPITYFLHPLTRHDRGSMARLFAGRRVDLGIHPDALDAPEQYDELFAQQVTWYTALCGAPPLSVRNHGFLNRGYWGHLPAWLAAGIRCSANLPGLDGRVLNGSLLPARVAWNGGLTRHWSMLTPIGDGVRFALGMSAAESANCVLDLAESIKASGVPGIVALNLHPQNITETVAMHRAVREVAANGFIAWTMRECLEWFERASIDLEARDG